MTRGGPTVDAAVGGGGPEGAHPAQPAPPTQPIEEHRRPGSTALRIRASDLAPYTGLGYLSALFRVIAVLLLLLLVAECVAGAASDDPDRWRVLLAEAARLVVVAGVLWGAGDLARLLIDIGHDVRATRVLLGRQQAHDWAHEGAHPGGLAPGAPVRQMEERSAAGGEATAEGRSTTPGADAARAADPEPAGR